MSDDLIREIYSYGKHLAAGLLEKYGRDEFVAQLEQRVKAKLVARKNFGNLSIYNYLEICNTKYIWDIWIVIARGLVIDRVEKRIVSWTFPRFFNYGNLSDTLREEITHHKLEVFEKMDGTFISLFYYGKWMMASRYSFDAPQVAKAQEYISELKNLDTSRTYLFELIWSKHNIVIDYHVEDEGLYLIGCFDNLGFEHNNIQELADFIGARAIRTHNFDNIDQIVEHVKTLDFNHEGYVCRLENGMRFKIKSHEYIEMNNLMKRGCTCKTIWKEMDTKHHVVDLMKKYTSPIAQKFIQYTYDKYMSMIEEIIQDIVHDYRILYHEGITYQEMIQEKIKHLPEITKHASQCFRLLMANVKLDENIHDNALKVCWHYALINLRSESK